MSRFGCYTLLKNHHNRGIRGENSYSARDYTIGKHEQRWYYLSKYNTWVIYFDLLKVSHFSFGYIQWTVKIIPQLEKYLSECRFDLVYKLMNKN